MVARSPLLVKCHQRAQRVLLLSLYLREETRFVHEITSASCSCSFCYRWLLTTHNTVVISNLPRKHSPFNKRKQTKPERTKPNGKRHARRNRRTSWERKTLVEKTLTVQTNGKISLSQHFIISFSNLMQNDREPAVCDEWVFACWLLVCLCVYSLL